MHRHDVPTRSVGGGITIGLGKAISIRTGLPHVCIPTTYAGSETTPILGDYRLAPSSATPSVVVLTSLMRRPALRSFLIPSHTNSPNIPKAMKQLADALPESKVKRSLSDLGMKQEDIDPAADIAVSIHTGTRVQSSALRYVN